MGLGLDLLPIVQALAAAKEPVAEGYWCVLCGAHKADRYSEAPIEHDPSCPWLLARAELEPLERAVGESGECGSCRAPIKWIVTKAGKRAPVELRRLTITTADGATVSGFESHFAHCPNALSHRKRR